LSLQAALGAAVGKLRGLWRWGRLADFWPRSGRHEADCPQ